ncbi:MAG: ATP-binding protein [Epsilonproteobacteria bacterium]|nr:ATP-binding protein [Campylobacterota bacterium]
MEILLEEFYKTDLHLDKFHPRKLYLDAQSYQISGITKSGKTQLVKSYLLTHKKSSYLYINCNDIRIDIPELNKTLGKFCLQNSIDILVLDNYKEGIEFPNVSQLIITNEQPIEIDFLYNLTLYPLDYEEFLAYEQKYDASALNHFVQLGGLSVMHKIPNDERISYLQRTFQNALDAISFDILVMCAKFNSQKISPFNIYERLKSKRKISKDKLYKSFEALVQKNYIHQLGKFEHTRATKKVYLCDTSLKAALSVEKHFGRLFENMIFLELKKKGKEIYYDEGVDFYLPKSSEVILCKPFADEKRLFKKLESIEAFLFTHSIAKITVITMNKEATISHPLSQVAIIPFDIWALGDL